jgi:GNAT superfamily N-acetyltransferase
LDPEISLEAARANIELDGKRLGFIDAWEDEEVEWCVWVKYVYVLKKYRETGIGTKAVEMALEKWRKMEFFSVSLDDVHWLEPRDSWGKLGFKGEGKRKTLRL